MTYPEAVKYLNSFINYEKRDSYDYNSSFRLERMKRLASLLGDPQNHTRSVHVAGSKGKGSTSAFIHSMLKQAGFRTGLYTSPHLTSFRERIRIGDSFISEGEAAGIVDAVRMAVERLGDDTPSFFEVYTAVSFMYFRDKGVDIAVYETGLGGRLDATNIITPLATAITPVSLEHTSLLGSTVADIAREKAGIVKNGVPCVIAPQEEAAHNQIREICVSRNAPMILVGRDILFRGISFDDAAGVFDVVTALSSYAKLRTRLLGEHQAMNAATAIGVVETLRSRGLHIPSDAIRRGVEGAKWPGRMEVVERNPLVVLDGAQNGASAGALAASVKKIFKYNRLILILGVSRDKDVAGMLKEILPISDEVILTKSKIVERALEPSAIRAMIYGKDTAVTSDIEEAIGIARSRATGDDIILVTGSLFLVGEAREILAKSSR